MFGKLFNRVPSPERKQPEIVCWLADAPHNTLCRRNGTTFRELVHDGISLSVSIPEFAENTTWIYVELRNDSRKALGLRMIGFGLVHSANGETRTLACKRLTDYGKECTDIMVEVGSSHWSIAAGFASAPMCESGEVIIEANRIFAPPYLFRIPFEMDTRTVE
jgi:hypothetical protein